VANLDVLFLQARLDEVPADLVAAWNARLERELSQGRLRTELAYAFGRLLEEAARPREPEPAPPGPPPVDLEPGPGFRRGYLAGLIAALPDDVRTGARADLAAFVRAAQAPCGDSEVQALLGHLSGDPLRPAPLRREAAGLRNNPMQVHELAGVLTILLDNL